LAQSHASNPGGGGHGFGGGGRGFGGGGRGFGGGGFGGGRFSDIRLKEDIVSLGRLANGIGVYRFRYRGNDHTTYVGVMAQEVQNIVPTAVSRGRDGYLRVDYDMLGLKFLTWDEWVTGTTLSPTTQ
jgi:Chaperone of endosialidase